jgi:FkbM family methyltransferase
VNPIVVSAVRTGRALRHAFGSEGFRLFGLPFARDYLRFAAGAAARWGSTDAGTLALLGTRIDYFNRSHALFLLHEIFVDATYAFSSSTARPRVLDCGANIGFSVVFFKALYPGAIVTAIEPDAVAFARLETNLARNGMGDVRLINAAVADHEGAATLYTSGTDPGSLVTSLHGEWGGGAARQVQAVRLSSLVDGPVDFLKVDVEGAEYGVVRDLIATGAIRQVREMVVEHHELDSEPGAGERMMRDLEAAGLRITRLASSQASRIGVIRGRRVGLGV